MVVPNSTLNKETIMNFSRPRPHRMEMIDVEFSYQDPPYKVRQALDRAGAGHRGRPRKPAPIAATLGYGDFSIKYRLIYRTVEEDRWPVRNELVTRIWYMAQASRIHDAVSGAGAAAASAGRPFKEAEPERGGAAGQFPRLPKIPPEDRPRTRRLTFGAGERLFDEGDELDGVLVRGVRRGVAADGHGRHTRARLRTVRAGEFCGETRMHGHQAADMRAVALEDTEVVLIAPDAVRHLFEASPRLARDTGHALDVHRKAVQSARSAARQG